MPSEANAKHADTSHAQNRRSPHLYPSRRSQGSTYAGVPPPFALCLYPLQASWHPLHKMCTAHHSAGTQFLFWEGLWNSVARLPVEDPHSCLSCESTCCPDHRSEVKGCRCKSAVLSFYRNNMWKTGKNSETLTYTIKHQCTWTRTELFQGSCVGNERSVLIRVKTYRFV